MAKDLIKEIKPIYITSKSYFLILIDLLTIIVFFSIVFFIHIKAEETFNTLGKTAQTTKYNKHKEEIFLYSLRNPRLENLFFINNELPYISSLKAYLDNINNEYNALILSANTESASTTNIPKLKDSITKYLEAQELAQNYKIFNINTSDTNANITKVNLLISKETEREREITIENSIYSVKVPILMYHYIRINPIPSDIEGFDLSVTPTDFDSQMNYLSSNGYTTITLSDLVSSLKTKKALPKNPIIITFDDGYDDLYSAAFPILQKYNLKAETFVISAFVGRTNYITWPELQTMVSSNLISVGSHTVDHSSLIAIPLQNVVNEVTQSKTTLESNLGIKVTDFCYPSGEFNSQVISDVEKAGYSDALTTQEGDIETNTGSYTIPRIRISGGMDLNDFILAIHQ